MLPLAVTYYTPRHLYLAAAGLAIAAGLLIQLVLADRSLVRVLAAVSVTCVLVATCVVGLQAQLDTWNASAVMSGKMASDMQRVAASAPQGSLLLVGARPTALPANNDRTGSNAVAYIYPPPGSPWLWSWALPYALEPPFAPVEIASRISVLEPADVYCCRDAQWLTTTRQTVAAWASDKGQASDRIDVGSPKRCRH